MINLAQIEDKVIARLQALSAEDLEKRLRAKGHDVKVIENQPAQDYFFTLESTGEICIVSVQQYFDEMSVFAKAANANELALAA